MNHIAVWSKLVVTALTSAHIALNSTNNVATDHYLIISKIHLPRKWYTFIKRSLRQEEILGYIY